MMTEGPPIVDLFQWPFRVRTSYSRKQCVNGSLNGILGSETPKYNLTRRKLFKEQKI